MEAAAALSAPRRLAALDVCALFSPPTAIPSSPASRLRISARPRVLPSPHLPRRRGRHPQAEVIPFLWRTAFEQPPPDLASFLYRNRIFYVGMCLVPSVTELMLAKFLYLQYEDTEKPIYMYINFTGTTKEKYACAAQANGKLQEKVLFLKIHAERDLHAHLKRRVANLVVLERARKKQRARIKNLKADDANTKYLHRRIITRRKNHITKTYMAKF